MKKISLKFAARLAKISVCFLILLFTMSGAAAQDEPKSEVDRLFDAAEKFLDEENFDAAIGLYDKIIALAPDNPDGYNGRGFAYLEKKDFDRAIADYSKVIELKPDDFFAFYSRGTAHFGKGDYDKAVDDHTEELRLLDSRALGYLGRGAALMKLGETDSAIVDFTKGIEEERPAGFWQRGLAYKKKGDKAAAIRDLRRALELAPDFKTARAELTALGVAPADLPAPFAAKPPTGEAAKFFDEAMERFIARHEDAAILRFKKATAIDPTLAAAFYYVGRIFHTQVLYGKSLFNLDLAIKADPKFAEAHRQRGQTYLFTGDANNRKMLADMNRAVLLAPQNAKMYLWRGKGFDRTKNAVKARADYAQAIKLDANFFEAYVARAESLAEAKQYAAAINDFTRALEIRPDGYIYKLRAEIYCKQGKKDSAADDERRAAELGEEIYDACAK